MLNKDYYILLSILETILKIEKYTTDYLSSEDLRFRCCNDEFYCSQRRSWETF